jgi:hypothetical protein
MMCSKHFLGLFNVRDVPSDLKAGPCVVFMHYSAFAPLKNISSHLVASS